MRGVLVAAFLALCTISARADTLPLGPASISANIGTSVVQVYVGPGAFYGLTNVGNGLQTGKTNCYDTASGATTGTPLPGSGWILGAGGTSTESTFAVVPYVGVAFKTGLACQTAGAVVGSGPVALWYRF